MLIESNFPFSHSVFKRLVQQTSKNKDLFGKGLTREIKHLTPTFISVCQACEFFNRELTKLSDITRNFNDTIVLLENLPISVSVWNICKLCDTSEEAFNHDINEQIGALNTLIRTFDQENSGLLSPRFGLDLEIGRKKKHKKSARKCLNFKLSEWSMRLF